MYPITFTLTNILKIISFMSPFLLSLTIILFSILSNKIVEGLVLLIGIVIVTFITYLLKNIIKSRQSSTASPFCNILPTPFTYRENESVFDSPSLSTTVLSFISSYLIFPMITHNNINPAIIIFSLFIICSNGVVEFMDNCSGLGGIVLGFIVGIILGVLYYNLIVASGNRDIAYFNEIISNNTQCSKPSEKKFRCRKYVRGDRDKSGEYIPDQPSEEQERYELPMGAASESNFKIRPLWADPSVFKNNSKLYAITTTEMGNEGKEEARIISNILKCDKPLDFYNNFKDYNNFNLQGRKGTIDSSYNEFIVDCSNASAKNFLTTITGDTSWGSHKNKQTDILNNFGTPQLDILRLYTFDNNGETPINFYVIPGAGNNKICDSLANEIGCTQCISANAFSNSVYNVGLNLIFEDPANRRHDFSQDSSFSKIITAKDAGWGLTQCPDGSPKDTQNLKVNVHTINMSELDSRTNKYYGKNPVIKDNRYAYWLD